MSREFQDRLARRARRVGVPVDAELNAKLETYFQLLSLWNRKINLTGFNLDDPTPAAIDKLLIEPLVAARFVESSAVHVMDVGSGGGSPAIPMLLAIPRLRMRLVESKTRKCVFLREVLRSLEIDRSDVITARFEELLSRPELHETSDLLTVRAVRVEARVLMSLQAFVKPGGEMFLFRSGSSGDSAMLTPPLSIRAAHPLSEAHSSTLLVVEKRSIGLRRR